MLIENTTRDDVKAVFTDPIRKAGIQVTISPGQHDVAPHTWAALQREPGNAHLFAGEAPALREVEPVTEAPPADTAAEAELADEEGLPPLTFGEVIRTTRPEAEAPEG